MKKLLFVISNMNTGGAEIQTLNHINELHARNHPVFLAVLSNKTELLKKISIPESNILVLKSLSGDYTFKNIIRTARRLYSLVEFVESNDISILVGVMNLAHFAVRLVKFRLFYKKIHVIIYHRNAFYKINPTNTISKYLFDRLNVLLGYILDNKTIFISESVRNNIEKRSFTRNPFVIPNSVRQEQPTKYFAEHLADKYNLLRDTYIIVVPARLHWQKGHSVFIEGFKKMAHANKFDSKETRVFFAGDGEQRESITKEIEEAGLTDLIHLLGTIDHTSLLSLYAFSDLIVLPSLYEGFGNVAIEALMLKKKILVSEVGGLKDIIIDSVNGYFFEVGNSASLAEKLQFIYESRDKETLSEDLIYKSYRDSYSLEIQVSRLLKVFYGDLN